MIQIQHKATVFYTALLLKFRKTYDRTYDSEQLRIKHLPTKQLPRMTHEPILSKSRALQPIDHLDVFAVSLDSQQVLSMLGLCSA